VCGLAHTVALREPEGFNLAMVIAADPHQFEAHDRYGLAADTIREVVEEAFEQADDLARMLVG
jgi:hypothetical protein